MSSGRVPTTFTRPSLREALIAEIRSRIVRRQLRGDRPVDLGDIAAELGVSRTPVREALIALERDGFLRSISGRGFFVIGLTKTEAGDLYPLVGALEALALRTRKAVPNSAAEDLRRLNGEIGSEIGSPESLLRLDGEWHERLLAPCDNEKLRRQLRLLKGQLHRYEFAYMSDAGSISTSVHEHAAILDALDAGKIARAARLLEEHWRRGATVMAEWLAGGPLGP